MSYALSGALQAAVFAALSSDTALDALVGGAIYDAVPAGTLPDIYIRLGDEQVTDASDGTGAGARHRFAVSIITAAPGFATAKQAAGAVCDALHGADLTLDRGTLVFLNFERATAQRRDGAQTRQIDLRFVARLQDD
ncbi:DUF3168 domain-containing protein [Sulfitobacter sp. S190]|uniref:DUF3168 domain-containing protein n=1 Tax=Sulfitobacter sp. S190 TaxID=2867022 RepID=UPI0021A68935|nr:DUF3168 domain-containing protein [Sulfitobacter sp. S190]UWR21042.1 DUF3168 domain-containing protein [Sulfitobacter sp. S190]